MTDACSIRSLRRLLFTSEVASAADCYRPVEAKRRLEERESIMRKIAKAIVLSIAERYLYFVKRQQKPKFDSLSDKAIQHYRAMLKGDIPKFCLPAWLSHSREAEEFLIPRPKFSFVRERLIRNTMFIEAGGGWLHRELEFLKSRYSPRRLRELLIEDYVGMPTIQSARYLTSHNSVHHLYHIAFYEHKCGISVKRLNSVIEWGGGYGNMAKIIRRMNPSLTYTIVDIPIFSCIQWLYLSTVFHHTDLNIITDTAMQVADGKINILPLSLVEQHRPACELFVSTWALSESSRVAQDYVSDNDFFGAGRLLLAFQDSCKTWPNADRVGKLADKRGAKIERIDFLPGNYYALR